MALLEIRGISKSFTGVQALSEVDLDVQAGEVHALIGENGAGKSTLIKILGGVYRPDGGEIRLDGKPITFTSPQDSKLAGIHTLYQEFNLLPEATVAENIFLGSEPRHRYLPIIDWRKVYDQTAAILDMIGLDIAPDARVSDLSVAQQQMVELAKTLHAQPKLLLMDEPTATLSEREVRTLFGLIRLVKARGIGLIYISHRLDEVLQIADRISVLRDGHRVATVSAANASVDNLASDMLGKAVNRRFSRQVRRGGAEVLRVENLTREPTFENVSFELYAGEIVGLAGLVGSGRTALVRCIFGLDLPDSGKIYVDEQAVSIQSPRDAVALGMGMLPEDRQEQALLLDMSVRENITLAQLGQAATVINQHSEHQLVKQYIERLRIKMPDPEAKTRFLSGGTQQKVIVSRWLAIRPRILIFDEPTRGIDIGGKIEIYRVLGELASQGMTILMISSELSEIVGLCDRALIMRAGHLVTSLDREHITEEALLHHAMGETL